MTASAAQRRANQKQDATRKRVALWLDRDGPEDKALRRLMRKHKLDASIDALRLLLADHRDLDTARGEK